MATGTVTAASESSAAAAVVALAGLTPTFNVSGKKKPDAAAVAIAIKDVKVVKDFNARKDFGDIDELATSIKKVGLLQPIVVRPIGDGKYHLIAGERRFRAIKSLEHETIPAIVRDLDDSTAEVINLVENGDGSDGTRKPLAAAELGNAFKRLGDRLKIDPAGIAKLTGFNHMKVRRHLEIVNNLTPALLKRVGPDGDLSVSAATALAEIKDEAIRSSIKVVPGMTADSIKLAAKEAAGATVEGDKGGTSSSGGSSSSGRSIAPIVWRKASAMGELLRQASHMLVEGASDPGMTAEDIYRLHGVIGTLMFLRNDSETPEIPLFVDPETRKFVDVPEKLPENMTKKAAKSMAVAIRAESEKNAELLKEADEEAKAAADKEAAKNAPKPPKVAKAAKSAKGAAPAADDVVAVSEDDDDAVVAEDDGD